MIHQGMALSDAEITVMQERLDAFLEDLEMGMRIIVLTPEQADAVRGETAEGHGLDPREMADGSFGLPARVLDDPAHASLHPLLRDLPLRDLDSVVWAELPE